MSKALVTIGSMTDHGGIVSECDNTFIINGIAVHLNGMKHFCLKCKILVSAIASDQTTVVNGRAVVVAGDKTTCGATFLGNQHLVVAQPKSSSSASSAISKLNSIQSPVAKAASSLPNMTMGLTDKSHKPEGPFTSGRADPDATVGILSSMTFGLSEKIGVFKPDDPNGSGYATGVIVGAIIGPNKAKIATNLGRTGKTAKLRELATDPKLGKSDKGWLKQEINEIARGKKKHIRNPPGKDLAHQRGREASKGYGYTYSNLQDKVLHKLQHKFDNFGRKNKERPPE